MNVTLWIPNDEVLRARRPCGCWRAVLPDIVHWWRFTRLRLVGRKLQGWKKYLQILWESRSHQKVCEWWVDRIVPQMVGMGLVDPFEALDDIREGEKRAGRWKAWERDQLFLGADSDHPDGIYAESGSDLVCMTNEEYVHWYGRCGHSGGNSART